jgi:hypothetical protein
MGFCVEGYGQAVTWRKFYVASGNPTQSNIWDIIQTENGGYIFTGTRGSGSVEYLYAYGINSYGDSLWYKEYPYAIAASITKLNDGNYMLKDAYCTLIKITPIGDTIWTKYRTFTSNQLYGNAISYYNSEFIISGWNSYTNKPFILRLDSLGNDIFFKEYNYNFGYVLGLLVNDNRIYLSGYEILPYNYFLFKTDIFGNVVWVKDYNQSTLNFVGTGILKTPSEEESIILGGYSGMGDGTATSLMKRDTAGNIQWHKIFDRRGHSWMGMSDIKNDLMGGIISLGLSGPDNQTWLGNTAFLIKFNYDGIELWRKHYGFGGENGEHFRDKCFNTTNDSGYIIGGLVGGQYSQTPIHIIKTDKHGNVVSINNNSALVPSDIKLYQNFPNPFNPITRIKFELSKSSKINISIYDLNGRLIKSLTNNKYEAGIYSVIFQPENLSSGVYFYSLQAENIIISKKFIYLK